MTKLLAIYIAAAVAEIDGCYGFWVWARLDGPSWWLAVGACVIIVGPGRA